MIDHFATQVNRVQDRLGRQILIENPACFLTYANNAMSEPEFLGMLIQRSGCGLLLDINNIVVTTGNLGGNAAAYLMAIDPDWVGEIHLAGHATQMHESGPLYIDDHGSPVGDAAWALYEDFIARAGPKPTLIEWDNSVPDYAVLMAQAARADSILGCKNTSAYALPQKSSVSFGASQYCETSDVHHTRQANFITTINNGPDALDPTVFAGTHERIMLGLNAHANTINHARLMALDDGFPLTRKAMGDTNFRTHSRAYIKTEKARAYDNNSIGRAFPQFLNAAEIGASLCDLAAIEWAWLESYHAPDATPLALTALSGLSRDALLACHVKVHPAARCVPLNAPIDPALHAVAAIMPNPTAVLAVRPDAEVHLLPINAAMAAAFSATRNGVTIGNLLTHIADQPGISDPTEPFLTLLKSSALIAP